MTIALLILLAFVLSIDAYVVAAGCSLSKKIAYSQGFLLAVCFSILHTLLLIGGYYIAWAMKSGETVYDTPLAAVMLVFAGVKMILRVVRKNKDVNTTYVTDSKSILLLSLATSIDFFIVGLGLGFAPDGKSILWCAIPFMFFTVVSTFFGVLMGRQKQRKSRRWATFVVGLLLIGLAILLIVKMKNA